MGPCRNPSIVVPCPLASLVTSHSEMVFCSEIVFCLQFFSMSGRMEIPSPVFHPLATKADVVPRDEVTIPQVGERAVAPGQPEATALFPEVLCYYPTSSRRGRGGGGRRGGQTRGPVPEWQQLRKGGQDSWRPNFKALSMSRVVLPVMQPLTCVLGYLPRGKLYPWLEGEEGKKEGEEKRTFCGPWEQSLLLPPLNPAAHRLCPDAAPPGRAHTVAVPSSLTSFLSQHCLLSYKLTSFGEPL